MSAVIIARGVDLAFKSLLSATYRDESAFVANAEESRDDDPWEVRSEHQNWTRELEKQSVVFDNIITQLLLPQIVEDEHNIRLLILGKDESIWADPRLDATLRQRLRAPVEQLDHPHTGYQTSYDIFRAKLRAIECSLDALGKELRNAKSFLRSSSLGEVRPLPEK
jgi:hypothetical protein